MKILKSINNSFIKQLSYLDKKVERRYVVIESDDWGMIRMPSKSIFNKMLQKGYPVDKCPYCINDTLESNKDMEILLDVLDSIKDNKGNNVVFTANNIVANPDFESIRSNGYNLYVYEKFTDTLKRYSGRENVKELYEQGMQKGIFLPQFHGREHLNVPYWMEKLANKQKAALEAFNHGFYSLPINGSQNSSHSSNLDAYGSSNSDFIEYYKESIKIGVKLFKELHGRFPTSFIAPCYTWHPSLEETLSTFNINIIQGNRKQVIYDERRKARYWTKVHYTGQVNRFGQMYSVRNVFFEPFVNPQLNWVDNALLEISRAFKRNRPAIISTHRANFVGSINNKNQQDNIKLFKKFLFQIVKYWPDVEFVSSNKFLN